MSIKKINFFKKMWLAFLQKRFTQRYSKTYVYQQLALLFFTKSWESYQATHQFWVQTRRTANTLPLALVLGEGASGKTTVLTASHAILPQSDLLNTDYQPITNRSMPRYYATGQRLFIEMPQYFFVNESAKKIPYLEQLFLFWKKVGYFNKINQIIFTVRLTQLFEETPRLKEKRQEFWSSLALLVNQIKSASVEIYIVMTELDRLQGFTEFFADLSIEERQHIFGFALNTKSPWLEQIKTQFTQLKKRLQRRMWWRAQSEYVAARRLFVAEFSEQFSRILEPLLQYLAPLEELRHVNPNVRVVLCSFVSTLQQGNLVDLLLDTKDDTLEIVSPTLPMIPQNKVYFVRGVFQRLFGSAQAVQSNTPRFYKKYFLKSTLLLATCVFVGFLSVVAYYGVKITQDLGRTHGALAYQLITNPDRHATYAAFIAYEGASWPKALQYKVAESTLLAHFVKSQAKNYLNTEWQTVWNYYQQHIALHYPIDPKSKEELSLETFQAFYGPNGVLGTFYHRYITSSEVVQAWLPENKAAQALFYAYVKMQSLLYADAQKLTISFTAYSQGVNETIKKVHFMFAGMSMDIEPHVLAAKMFHWPNKQGNQESGYMIEYAAALPQLMVFQGTWSWLRLLENMRWQEGEEGALLLMPQNQSFRFMVNGVENLSGLPQLFAQLTIPEHLFS